MLIKRPARLLAASAALALALPAPAAAQYSYPQPYPQQTYPQTYPYQGQQYGYGQQGTGNPVTGIIDQLLGNRYSVTDRQAIRQCARAAMSQASSQYGGYNRYGGYNQYGYNQQQYGYGRFRVTGITDVQRRSTGLRVVGMLDSGRGYGGNGGYGYGNQGYGEQGYGNQGYGAYPAGGGDFSFRCNVDYRGAVTFVRVRPIAAYRSY